MGKIFNALEKYRQERLLTRPVSKLRNADREALLKYDRHTGKLNLNSSGVIKDPGTIDRLLENKMISPDGKLTAAGRQMTDEYRNRHPDSKTGKHDQSIEQDNLLQKSAESVPSLKLKESDLSALVQYDRETKNILKYDSETCRLDESSKGILREPDVIQRLIDSGLILPGGWLTSRGLQVIEKMALWKKKGHPETLDFREIEPDQREEEESIEIIEEAAKETKKIQPPETVSKTKEVKDEAQKAEAAKVPPVTTVKKAPAISPDDELEKKVIGTKPASVTYQPDAIDKNLVSLLDPHSYEAEQFKILRTNLLYPVSGKIPRSIAITSTMPGEGKSFVAANLAISIANEIDRYVLLIDCDLRRPAIHKLFGFGNVSGLSHYLSHGTPLESLLLGTKVDKLSILPAGNLPPNPSELLSSERMAAMLQEVATRYRDRLIILDTPPPTMTAETGALARVVDGILVVVKYGGSSKDDVEDLIRTMGKEKIIGSVMNNVDLRSSRHYGYRKVRGQYYAVASNAKS